MNFHFDIQRVNYFMPNMGGRVRKHEKTHRKTAIKCACQSMFCAYVDYGNTVELQWHEHL